MSMVVAMPEPDRAVLVRRDRIVKALSAIVPGEGVIASEAAMRPYETDGLTAYPRAADGGGAAIEHRPVSRILAYCHREGIRWCHAAPALPSRVARFARRRRSPWHGQVQPHPRDRL